MCIIRTADEYKIPMQGTKQKMGNVVRHFEFTLNGRQTEGQNRQGTLTTLEGLTVRAGGRKTGSHSKLDM